MGFLGVCLRNQLFHLSLSEVKIKLSFVHLTFCLALMCLSTYLSPLYSPLCCAIHDLLSLSVHSSLHVNSCCCDPKVTKEIFSIFCFRNSERHRGDLFSQSTSRQTVQGQYQMLVLWSGKVTLSTTGEIQS